MAKPFKELRDALHIAEIRSVDLARELLLSTGSISNRLMAKQPWTLDECYKVLELLNRPPSDLPKLFPRNGQNDPEVKRPGHMSGRRRRVIA